MAAERQENVFKKLHKTLTNFPVKIPHVSKFRRVFIDAIDKNLLMSSCGKYIRRSPLIGVETGMKTNKIFIGKSSVETKIFHETL